jgi:hypothetical protein
MPFAFCPAHSSLETQVAGAARAELAEQIARLVR